MADPSIIRRFEDILDPFCELDHTKFTTDKLLPFSIYLIPQNILPANPQLIDDSLLQNLLSKAREIGRRMMLQSLPDNFLYPPQRNRPFPSFRPYSPREWASRFNDTLSCIAKVDDPSMERDLRGVDPPALPYQPDYSNEFNRYLSRGQRARLLRGGKLQYSFQAGSFPLWVAETFLRSGIYQGVTVADWAVDGDISEEHISRSELLCSVVLLSRQYCEPYSILSEQSSDPPDQDQLPPPAWFSDDTDSDTLPLNLSLRFQIPIDDFVGSDPRSTENWQSIVKWLMFQGIPDRGISDSGGSSPKVLTVRESQTRVPSGQG